MTVSMTVSPTESVARRRRDVAGILADRYNTDTALEYLYRLAGEANRGRLPINVNR